MIAHIFGTVAEKFAGSVIVDVGGVGYEIAVAAGDYDKVALDQEVSSTRTTTSASSRRSCLAFPV